MRTQSTYPRQIAGPGAQARGLGLAEVLLLGAALLIGVAIISEPPLDRVLNGIGGVVWFVSGLLLAWRLRREPWAALLTLVAATMAIVLAAIVRPDSLIGAVIGFGVGGAVVGFLATRHPVSWAMLVPAIYLPAHVLIAITRSVAAGSVSVRSEPPPTAAIVPLAMVLAAAGAGLLVNRLRLRER
jgi:hypothetical protein